MLARIARRTPLSDTGRVASPALSSAAVIARLRAAGCIAAEDEARELLAAAPGADVLEEWLRRREDGEPLAWITGRVEFCGRRLHVDPGVYVPRPQTEELARRAASALAGGGRAADLCTGTGAIAAHLMAQVPAASVVAVDLDPVAVACARRNGVDALVGDVDALVGDAAALHPGTAFDVVTCVPPYVPAGEVHLLPADVQRYEPRAALDGGAEGLDIARRVVVAAARMLAPGGSLFIELGGDQDQRLAPDLKAAGFRDVEPWTDEDDELRGLSARTRQGTELGASGPNSRS
jgi:release factor glutamine methyltransferase